MEEYISQNLDLFLENYSNEMYGVSFTSLYNIFKHPSRKLMKHDIAYQFLVKCIIKSSQKNDDIHQNFCILISTLDSRQLTASNLIDSIQKREQHCGFVPLLDFSVIDKLNLLFSKLNIETNCNIGQSLDELGQKFTQIEIGSQEIKKQIEVESQKIKEQMDENQQLKKQIEIESQELKEQIDENQQLTKQIEIVRLKLDEKIDENQQLKEQIEVARLKLEEQSNENQQLKEQIEIVLLKMEEQIDENQQLKEQIEENTDNFMREKLKLLDDYKQEKDDLEIKICIGNEKINELQKEIEELKQKIQEMEDEKTLSSKRNNDSTELKNESTISTPRIKEDPFRSNDNSDESASICSENSIIEFNDLFDENNENQFDGSHFEIENIESLKDPPYIKGDKLTIIFLLRSRLIDFSITIKRFYIENKSCSQSNIGLLLRLIKKDYSSYNPNQLLKYNFATKEKNFKINFFTDNQLINEISNYLFFQIKPHKGLPFRICVFVKEIELDVDDFDPNRDGIPFAIPYKNGFDVKEIILNYLFSEHPNRKELIQSKMCYPTLYSFHDNSFKEIVDDETLEDSKKAIFVTLKSMKANEIVFHMFTDHIANQYLLRPI